MIKKTHLIFISIILGLSIESIGQGECKFKLYLYPTEAGLSRTEAEKIICQAKNRTELENVLRKHFSSNKGYEICGTEEVSKIRIPFCYHSNSRIVKYSRPKAGKGLESEQILTLNDFKAFPGDSIYVVNSIQIPERLKSRSFAKAGFLIKSKSASDITFQFDLVNRNDTLFLQSADSMGSGWLAYDLFSKVDSTNVLHSGYIRFSSPLERDILTEWISQISNNKEFGDNELPIILKQFVELKFGPTSSAEMFRFVENFKVKNQ